MVQGQQPFLAEQLLDGLAILAVHQHLDALGQKRRAHLALLQPQYAFLARHVGDVHQLLDAGLGFRQLELEGPYGGLEGTEELGEGKL